MPTDDVTLTGSEREAFEAWYKSRWSWTDDTVKRAAEEGWQARAALRPPAPAVAQETDEPREILAAKMIDKWAEAHGNPVPWLTAVNIMAIICKWPDAERDRLIAMSDTPPTEQPAASAQGRETE